MEGSHADRAPGFYQLDRFSQTNGDTPTPDRESLLDARGRKTPPLLLFNRVIRSLHRPRGSPGREGPVEQAHANRAPGLYWLDGFSQTTGGASTPDRERLLDARGRKTPPLTFFIIASAKFSEELIRLQVTALSDRNDGQRSFSAANFISASIRACPSQP
jgi:hypothetical protein